MLDAGKVFKSAKGDYQLMHNGVKVVKDCYYGYSAWMSDIIFGLKGHHEPQEERVFYEILKYVPEGSVMIEWGVIGRTTRFGFLPRCQMPKTI